MSSKSANMPTGSNASIANRARLASKRLVTWARGTAVRFLWYWLPIAVYLLALFITWVRTFVPSFEPLLNVWNGKHPLLMGAFALLASVAPDITSIMLGVLGLSYLIPGIVGQIQSIRTHRRGLVSLIVIFGLVAIVGNQASREKLDRWQTSMTGSVSTISNDEAAVVGNISAIASNQTSKPNWIDKALHDANLPSRILPPSGPQGLSGAVAGVVASQPTSSATSPAAPSAPVSTVSAQLSATEIAMIHETAIAAAASIQQDFDKAQASLDERYRKMRQNTIDSFVQSGHYTKEQAERLADGMNTPSIYALRAQESTAAAQTTYQVHKQAVEALVDVAAAHQSDPRRELISRTLELRDACYIDRVPNKIQMCIAKLKDVATRAN